MQILALETQYLPNSEYRTKTAISQ